MRRHITGIDHCFALVRNLQTASESYRRLGFTLSPRGVHSAHKGTANHTIMFERDYFELLGVVAPTPANQFQRTTLETREGLAAVALQTDDADKAAAEMRSAGIALSEPLGFARPVELPDGRIGEAAFRTTQFPSGAALGFHLFCCQHLTPETTWIPELLHHANTAYGIDHLTVLSTAPLADATTVASLLATAPVSETSHIVRVDTGTVPIRFQNAETLAAGYPGVDLTDLPESGLASLVVKVRSRRAAEAALVKGGAPFVAIRSSLVVAPRDACGVLVVFQEH
jgi:catechol 2,3-dioxygenase-like lactoylglutathione lyase family enzyme